MWFGLWPNWGSSQTEEPKSWVLSGYVKNLQTWLFLNDLPSDDFLQDNLLHQRLNFTWYLNDHWTFRSDLRTRAFFGDLVKQQPNYARLVDNVNNDYLDLSLVLLDQRSWVLHTMLDRLYFQYSKGDWEVRLGRQRVNWGIGTVWNPNDIFNAFAFTDFDYEERPGSDALRIRRFIGFASSVELVAKAADNFNESVIAGLWKFNRWNYDFQILTGYFMDDLAIGGGWAGNIKDAGFKGEWTYFIPLMDQDKSGFALTGSFDYAFEDGWYLQMGYLYNSNGNTASSVAGLFDFELSAKNLYPYRHALFTQFTYPINPLLNSGLVIIYSPVEVHPMFINPTMTLSVADNWNLDMVGQIVFNEQDGKFMSPLTAIFLRLKFSF